VRTREEVLKEFTETRTHTPELDDPFGSEPWQSHHIDTNAMADRIAALEARAEAGVTEAMAEEVAKIVYGAMGELWEPFSMPPWGADWDTFGQKVARDAAREIIALTETRVTEAMREAGARALCLGFRMTHRDGDQYAPYDHCTEEGKNVWRGLASTTLHAALTGGASDGE
jgi:hypothetical protein